MDKASADIIWNQFGASIDMLINIAMNCNDDYFSANRRFYYILFHSAIFLDYYATIPPRDFVPQLSFTPAETSVRPAEAIDDLIPDKFYSSHEIVAYLKNTRNKCRTLVALLAGETANLRFTEGNEAHDMDYSLHEIILYNMRHTQHHVAQLNLLWRQDKNQHLEWSFRAGDIKGMGV
ncbi:DinB family protein [Panacibacter sp. DH6]|uniref:DinB family protein n=1 Tax=Panacibacter microcysteis TaxID=2793269 RepID=A0A931E2C3_9BACT|nr:DinB family protein [Panacibacter microcysteis]MBG9377287.1 DinB family protein [Panacibacter microcysteis]